MPPSKQLEQVSKGGVRSLAAENAASVARGPGSFAVELLDALARLSAEQAADRVKIS